MFSESRAIYLDAQPFVVDSHESGLVSMYENELLVNFRTFESGIFFFSMADQGDLLIAQISGLLNYSSGFHVVMKNN